MEGSNDYDGGSGSSSVEKGESPRSNNSDPRDLRRKFILSFYPATIQLERGLFL